MAVAIYILRRSVGIINCDLLFFPLLAISIKYQLTNYQHVVFENLGIGNLLKIGH